MSLDVMTETADAATDTSVALTFGLTFDYLCPWARNLNEHATVGLRHGEPWSVRFIPYSLSQGHVTEEEPDIWERSDANDASGILALKVGLIVRDEFPTKFLDVHDALFAIRHDRGLDLKDPAVLAATLDELGIDGRATVDEAASPHRTQQLADEHRAGVEEGNVWGVPTVIGRERAVFLRVLDRPSADLTVARQRIGLIVDMVDNQPMIHEFKQTELAR